ncbi:Serpin I2 [Cryptotermes secundus]|uniref:Serpin I2 n=2 Tax=Cryptotermes secundus TaxID=105785 RepID=A0A2J7RIC4_9NEOP|nr:Serpin I2 [Cryptotermes secundus]
MWLASLYLLLCTSWLSRAQESSTAVSNRVAEATYLFSVDLFKAALKADAGNVVISPVSVSTLLALVQQGSGGNTATQLEEVLHLDPEQSRDGYSHLTRNLKVLAGNESLEFANGAFLNEGYQVKSGFRKVLEEDFLSSVETVQFSNSAAAAGEINSWVSNHTHGKIPNLVSPDSLDSLTRLVLVNAIYFKNFWKTSFLKNETRDDDFFIRPNTSKKVPTMHLKKKLLTGSLESLNSRWLQLPFQGNRFYLLIILPNEKDGVENLVNSITGPEISDLIENLEDRGYSPEVQLSLPKFKLQTTLELGPALKKIGLTDIFTDRANLTGISEEPVAVSQVIQKAEIEVDEDGATAAAATAIIIKTLSAILPPPPLVFRVDHPFIAFIVDDLNKLPLFACRVTDPTAS